MSFEDPEKLEDIKYYGYSTGFGAEGDWTFGGRCWHQSIWERILSYTFREDEKEGSSSSSSSGASSSDSEAEELNEMEVRRKGDHLRDSAWLLTFKFYFSRIFFPSLQQLCTSALLGGFQAQAATCQDILCAEVKAQMDLSTWEWPSMKEAISWEWLCLANRSVIFPSEEKPLPKKNTM